MTKYDRSFLRVEIQFVMYLKDPKHQEERMSEFGENSWLVSENLITFFGLFEMKDRLGISNFQFTVKYLF